MNEASRIAYLNAMGIDTYVARLQLPGAAASLRRAARPAAPATAQPMRPTALLRDVASESAAVTTGRQPAVQPGLPTVADGRPQAPDAPVKFSLAAIVAGGILWLEELRDGPLSTEQVQLVQGMARALGAGEEKPEVGHFDWPMHNNQQLDLGEEAARAALAGFIGRRLEQQACRAVVLLGQQCRLRVPAGQLGAATIVTTVSTTEMLVEPGRKRQAWRDLQPLRARA